MNNFSSGTFLMEIKQVSTAVIGLDGPDSERKVAG